MSVNKVCFHVVFPLTPKHFFMPISTLGRIQGALFSLQSLASALGPISLRVVYSFTKDYNPGFMFIFASFLFCIAAYFAFALPTNRTNSKFANYDNCHQKEDSNVCHEDENCTYGSL